ncbi:Uncharacterised protein [Cedecea neteri]|uniref:Uncharacterized protein n=1 Tax=Cedecea neteri TaxID=158822 RepID=A0A2X3JAT9_9ENTR|nr:Uncharacterised protein [Cedecea neteri]
MEFVCNPCASRDLRLLSRRKAYVATLLSRSPRFGIDGQSVGVVTESKAGFSQLRMRKMNVWAQGYGYLSPVAVDNVTVFLTDSSVY